MRESANNNSDNNDDDYGPESWLVVAVRLVVAVAMLAGLRPALCSVPRV